jgi:hypothetical protein
LGYENKVRNETDQAAYDKMQAAQTGWLDSEANYRLEVEREKEAEEGASFAREMPEKWAAAAMQTKERLDNTNTNVPKEQHDAAGEVGPWKSGHANSFLVGYAACAWQKHH